MLLYIEQHPTQLHLLTRMTSVNTPEEQAIALRQRYVASNSVSAQYLHVHNLFLQSNIPANVLAAIDKLGQCLTWYWHQHEPRSSVSSSRIWWVLVQLLTASSRRYYFSIVKNAKEFDRSDKYPEIPGDPSWQSVTAEEIGPIIIVEDSNDTIT